MGYHQYFCTIAELDDDLKLRGTEKAAVLLRAVRDASIFLSGKIGEFIPVTETRTLPGTGHARLYVPPLLAVTSITNDDDTLTSVDYILNPRQRHWRNGPYSWIEADPDSTLLAAWHEDREGVAIAGRWGKYEYSEASGATVGTGGQTSGAATLLADDGSKLSPGMHVLIGSEQELVTGYSTPSTAVTTLNGTITAAQDTITLADGTKVKVGEIIRCEWEQMRVDEIQTHSIAVTRGWNGTVKVAHTTAANIDVFRTFTVERGVNGTTAAAHTAADVIYRYQVPGDVNYLARQIAALMLKKASSGFAGKTGNSELGEVYYTNEFPRGPLAEISQAYHIPEAG